MELFAFVGFSALNAFSYTSFTNSTNREYIRKLYYDDVALGGPRPNLDVGQCRKSLTFGYRVKVCTHDRIVRSGLPGALNEIKPHSA